MAFNSYTPKALGTGECHFKCQTCQCRKHSLRLAGSCWIPELQEGKSCERRDVSQMFLASGWDEILKQAPHGTTLKSLVNISGVDVRHPDKAMVHFEGKLHCWAKMDGF